MTNIHTIYNAANDRRVLIFQRGDGTFGFAEERFADGPLEQAWIPVGRYSECQSDSAERALAEAHGRVSWMSGANETKPNSMFQS